MKSTNILIASDGNVKICDLGLSKLMTIEEQTMACGLESQQKRLLWYNKFKPQSN